MPLHSYCSLGTDGETEMQKAKVGTITEMGSSGDIRIVLQLLTCQAEPLLRSPSWNMTDSVRSFLLEGS